MRVDFSGLPRNVMILLTPLNFQSPSLTSTPNPKQAQAQKISKVSYVILQTSPETYLIPHSQDQKHQKPRVTTCPY